MQLKSGDKLIPINLPAIDGSTFDSKNLTGKPFLLSFYRFATCPFCNLRLNRLINQFGDFGEDFTMVAVFDSPLDNLKIHTEGHSAPFPILADKKNVFYRKYGIERSLFGMIKGMILRFPTLMKGMAKGYFPFPLKGSLLTMPADFLVDRKGIIQTAFYGKDEGDHLPIEEIITFSKNH